MTPSTPPGDWEVDAIINDVTSHWREDGRQGERGGIVFLDELREKLRARLREREAQVTAAALNVEPTPNEVAANRRAEAAEEALIDSETGLKVAEAEVARLREREAQSVEMNEHYQRKADEAEARVKEMQAAVDEGWEWKGEAGRLEVRVKEAREIMELIVSKDAIEQADYDDMNSWLAHEEEE